MRVPHLLRDNKSLGQPHNYIFFDTETLPEKISEIEEKHTLRLGVALFWRFKDNFKIISKEYLYFKEKQQFWDFVFSKTSSKGRIVVFAHNLPFDVRIVGGFDVLKEYGWQVKRFIEDNRVCIWEFVKGSRKILFLDTMNFFNVSLRRLGKDIGLEKMTMPDFSEDDDKWFVYCQRDVDIIFQAIKGWLRFIKENNLGAFAKTLASQSLNAYRHRFNKYPVFIHNEKQATELERESYHGGRTEAFFIGKKEGKEFYKLDVNSMYPSVMIKNSYPSSLLLYQENVSKERLKNYLKKYGAIARVEVETPEPVFATKENDRLIFPVGYFETVLTTRELKYAFSHNYIKEVKECTFYKMKPLFVGYVKFFYQKKREYKEKGNKTYYLLSKLFLNSLYGKWGQRNDEFEVVGYDESLPTQMYEVYDWITKEHYLVRIINGRIEHSVGKIEGYNAFPAISSHITADARMYLWKLFKMAGLENVFYVDTDGFFTNKQGLDNLSSLLDKYKIGYLKVEGIANHLEIRGLKDYTFGNDVKIKGIRKDAKKLDENTYLQTEFEGLRTGLRKKQIDYVIVRQEMKFLKREYTKGQVLENGKVIPFELWKKEIKDLSFLE